MNDKKSIVINILYFLVFWIIPILIFGLIYDQDLVRHLFSAIITSGHNFINNSRELSFVSFVFDDLISSFPINLVFLTVAIPMFIMRRFLKINKKVLLMWFIVDIIIILLISYFFMNYLLINALSNPNVLSF